MDDVNPLDKERRECMKMEFTIKYTWDGLPVSHEPVTVVLKLDNAGLLMEVNAPFFNDPSAPLGKPGKPFSRLWDYEGGELIFITNAAGRKILRLPANTRLLYLSAQPGVHAVSVIDWDHYLVVEAFFLSDRTEQYLEVELCPHGQHLVLLLSGKRRVWKEELPLEVEVTRMKTKWEGKAHLPWNYFPPHTSKFNAFAIHGSGEERKYEALYPVPQHELQEGQKPDFHRLEFFKDLNLKGLMGEDWEQPDSDIWKSLPN